MVFEIRPRLDFDKGQAVWSLLKAFPPQCLLPFYLGDDRTDEDAFRVVKKEGITVYVGPGKTISEAEYFLQNPMEVEFFLRQCEDIFRVKSKTISERNAFNLPVDSR